MKVPFNDLNRIHNPIKNELDSIWNKIVNNNSYILGEDINIFEDSFARYCGFSGKEHAAGVSSGTDALELALRALGIKSGDEVITQSNTFNATASSIRTVGATPVFVDIT